MFLKLIQHNWKSYWRSPFLVENLMILGLKMLFFLGLISSGYLAIKGSSLAIEGLSEYKNIFGVGLILYLVYDLILRFGLQSFPSFNVEPYLALPISRNSIIGNLFFRSLITPFVLIPLILLIPLTTSLIPKFEDSQFSTNSFIFLIGVILMNHFFIYWTSISVKKAKLLPYLLFAAITLFTFLQMQGYINVLPFLKEVSDMLFSNILLCLVPILVSFIFIYLMVRQFKTSIQINRNEGVEERVLPVQFFSKYGDAGKQVDFELNMILRIKGIRSIMYLSVFWLIYPLYLGKSTNNSFSLVFVSMFVTFGIVQYAMVCFAFHTYHFDALITLKKPATILKGKYYTLCLLGILITVFSTFFYGFMKPHFLPYIWASAMYNMTVAVFLSIYLSIKFMKPKNPYKSALFKQQTDFSIEAILISLISFAGIIIPFTVGYFLSGKWLGLSIIAVLSLILFILRNRIIDLLVDALQENRYKMISKYKNFNE